MTITTIDTQKHTLESLECNLSNVNFAKFTLGLASKTHKALQRGLGRNTELLGESVKTMKEDRTIVHTKVLYLAPHKMSGVNICPSAQTCIKDCLNTSGKGTLDSVQAARVNKTKQLLNHPTKFIALLLKEAMRHVAKCQKLGVVPAIRLNGTSDINWACVWDCMQSLGVTCYEYTKRLDIVNSADAYRVHITYSYQGSISQTPAALNNLLSFTGKNIAVVFALKPSESFPKTWHGMPVLDGDKTDNRFLDQPYHIVGLRAKGRARKSKNRAFIVHI